MGKKNIIIFFITFLIVVLASYFMFSFGITDKIKGSIYEARIGTKEGKYTSDLPVINMIINSSGKRIVNDSVTLTVIAKSNCNIKRLEYSVDLKKWKVLKDDLNDKNISTKIVFNDHIYGNVYIRVINEKGYSSYAYETSVRIDKTSPSLNVHKDDKDIIINANDNKMLSSIQYSNDMINWDDEEVSAESIILRKNNLSYKYVRVVDEAGNISEIKKIDDM